MVSKASPKTPKNKRKSHYMEGVLKGTAKSKWWQKFGRGVHMDMTAKMILVNLFLTFTLGGAQATLPFCHDSLTGRGVAMVLSALTGVGRSTIMVLIKALEDATKVGQAPMIEAPEPRGGWTAGLTRVLLIIFKNQHFSQKSCSCLNSCICAHFLYVYSLPELLL